jgi:hypothetical protein
MSARRSLSAGACDSTPQTLRTGTACLPSPDTPPALISFASGSLNPALGGGWCPGWPQATPKGPQGLDTRRSQRTLSRLEARSPVAVNHSSASRHPHSQPRPACSRCPVTHPGPSPHPSHPRDRQGSLICPCRRRRRQANPRTPADGPIAAGRHTGGRIESVARRADGLQRSHVASGMRSPNSHPQSGRTNGVNSGMVLSRIHPIRISSDSGIPKYPSIPATLIAIVRSR